MDYDVRRTTTQTAFGALGIGSIVGGFMPSGTGAADSIKIVGGAAVAVGLGSMVGSVMQQNGSSNLAAMLGQTGTTAAAGAILGATLSKGTIKERLATGLMCAIAGASAGFAVSVNDAMYRGLSNFIFDTNV